MPRPPRSLAAFAAAALLIDQRPEVLESIGCDQAGGREFPERILDLAREPSGGVHQLRQERSAAPAKGFGDFARGMRQRGGVVLLSDLRPGFPVEQPRSIVTQKN